MRVLIAVALLAGPVDLSRLEPIDRAVAAIEARHAAAGAPHADAERLERLLERDQEPLKALHALKLDDLPEGKRAAVKAAAEQRVADLQARNLAALLGMVPESGWFARETYGDAGATAAFLIVQHADLAVQKRFLPALERFAADKRIKPAQYGLLYDRVAVREGRPQRYGTQMRCADGRMVPEPIEDPDNLERRRGPMDFGWPTYADYLKMFGRC